MAVNTIPVKRNVRAIVLVVGLALIGGTGCITMSLIDRAQRASDDRATARKMEKERVARLATLTPKAEAGDPEAMLAVALDLLKWDEGVSRSEWTRALAMLERAAQMNHAASQAVLGELLLSGTWPAGADWGARLPGGAQPARGIALLQRAASQACRPHLQYPEPHMRHIEPAQVLATYFASHGEPVQALVWKARQTLYCSYGQHTGIDNSVRGYGTPEQRAEALMWAEFLQRHADAARIRASLEPAAVAAAQARAADLRRLVTESEQQFPAPSSDRRR